MVYDSDVDGIALISTPVDDQWSRCTVTAVNVTTMSILWSTSSGCAIYPSAEGLVIMHVNTDDTLNIQVIDTATGTVTASTDFASQGAVAAVGGGIVYTQSHSDIADSGEADPGLGCARDMTLGPCLWQGPGNVTWGTDSTVDLFGNYSWINTNDGVHDLRTGARAPFGSGCSQADGPTKDRALCETRSEGPMTYQQVDTTTGKAIGPVVTPIILMSFSDDSSVYVFLQDQTDTQSHLVGYSWDTGDKVFDTMVDILIDQPGAPMPQLAAGQAGSAFWAWYTDPSGTEGLAAFSLTSGDLLWNSAGASMVGIASVEGQSTVYVSNDTQLTAFDADTVQPVMTVDMPSDLTVTVSGGRPVALNHKTSALWVLNT